MPKGKKGKGVPDEGGPLSAEDKVKMLTTMNAAVSSHVAAREQQMQSAVSQEKDLSRRVHELTVRRDSQRETYQKITTDMTRQYKATQESLLAKINDLNHVITNLKDDLELSRITLEDTRKEKDQIIAAREAEMNELKIKMEQMANEFGDMLKEVLDKMSDRIEVNGSGVEKDYTPNSFFQE